MTPDAKEQAKAAIRATLALGEAIRELKEVPEGTLYAQVMGSVDIHAFQAMMGVLERAALIERDGNHLVRWIGPAKPEAAA